MGTLLALDLRDYLASGQGETVVAGYLPTEPPRAIAVRETGGVPSVHTMSSGPGAAYVERPGVQVLSRAATYAATAQIAANVHHLLDGFRPRTINGTSYEWAEALQQPFELDRDENGRIIFACNYLITKARSTSTST